MTELTPPSDGPVEGDAFGAALAAYQQTGSGREIIERDDGYLDTGIPIETYFAAKEDWPERTRTALESLSGSVLDIGCGAGRHALALQEQGCSVTAIDVSAGAVRITRERGVEDVREAGIEDLELFPDDHFDAVVLLGNNFGLVGRTDRAPAVLSELDRITTADGVLLAESQDPTSTSKEVHLQYHERNRERGFAPGRLRMRVRHQRLATPWYEYLLVGQSRMQELCERASWTFDSWYEGAEAVPQYIGRFVSS